MTRIHDISGGQRLAILSTEFPPGPGGIGTHAYQLARQLTAIGWKVMVVAVQDYASDREVEEFNASQAFEVTRLRRAPAPLRASRRCASAALALARFGPDVALATGRRFAWMSAVLARRYRLPWIAVGHGTEFGDPRAWASGLTRWAFGRATSVVCVSQYTWGRMLKFGVKPRGGRIIPNGADHTRFRRLPEGDGARYRDRTGLAGRRVLLTVGNVTDRKGQDVVIRALPQVLRRFPSAHYVMAGLPSRKAELLRLARELNVADHVRFLGKVDAGELVELVNACDVFVLTSRRTGEGAFEGFGIAVIEAALCGKPAVVSASSGLAEAVENGRTGICVPEDDAPATARAICDLLEHDERRLAMGDAALARALSAYTWSRKAAEYDGLLRDLIRQ